MKMEIFLVGLGILIAAIITASDETFALKKVIYCLAWGITLGVIIMIPFGIIAGTIAPGTVNPLWKDMLFGGIFGGIIGAILGIMGGLVVFVLSVLIRLVKTLYYWL